MRHLRGPESWAGVYPSGPPLAPFTGSLMRPTKGFAMSMQDEINTMLARILDISSETAQIQQHLDNLLADPTPFLKEESDALIQVIKERLAQQQETINEA